MTNPVLVGLAVTSGTTSSTKQALFDNVTITQTGVTDAASAAARGKVPRRRDPPGHTALRFMYVLLSRNFTITAKVNGLAGGAGAGLMLWQNTAAGAIEASLLFEPQSNQVVLRRQTADGGTTTTTGCASGTSRWVRLVRTGTTVKAYKSSNGAIWTQVGVNVTVSLLDPVRVGLAVTGQTSASAKQAIFDRVTLTEP